MCSLRLFSTLEVCLSREGIDTSRSPRWPGQSVYRIKFLAYVHLSNQQTFSSVQMPKSLVWASGL